MATARYLLDLCKLPDGGLYMTGGFSIPGGALADVERYDPDLDTWSAAPPLPRPRYAHCACVIGDAMYVLGGVEKDEERGEHTVSSVLKPDSSTQTWSEVALMPAERDSAGMCGAGSNIFIIGGRTDDMEVHGSDFHHLLFLRRDERVGDSSIHAEDHRKTLYLRY
jgi:N-acetylneuraminic acid mutarotase